MKRRELNKNRKFKKYGYKNNAPIQGNNRRYDENNKV